MDLVTLLKTLLRGSDVKETCERLPTKDILRILRTINNEIKNSELIQNKSGIENIKEFKVIKEHLFNVLKQRESGNK